MARESDRILDMAGGIAVSVASIEWGETSIDSGGRHGYTVTILAVCIITVTCTMSRPLDPRDLALHHGPRLFANAPSPEALLNPKQVSRKIM